MMNRITASSRNASADPSAGARQTTLRHAGSSPDKAAFRSPGNAFGASWLDAFEPIALAQLNARSAMLERLDNKYIVMESDLVLAVAELRKYFDILEINARRSFTYQTCYFDDTQRTSYHEHHQGRRQRCKIRVRKYADTQACFVEVKLKDKRGITVKKRLECSIDQYGTLDADALAHVDASYRQLYGRGFTGTLEPVLEIVYKRVSLAAKRGGERMTVDSGIAFSRPGRSHALDDGIFIVETKSANGNGLADRILREIHQHPTTHCSKYCIAAAALRVVDKHNNFLPVLRRVDAIPPPSLGLQRIAGQPRLAPELALLSQPFPDASDAP